MLIWLFVEFLSVIYAKYSIISDNWPHNHHSVCFAPRFVGALPFEPNHRYSLQHHGPQPLLISCHMVRDVVSI